jgi:hypothetical protein
MMIHGRDVIRAAALAALLTGTAAAQAPEGVARRERAPFPPRPFGHGPFEPRVEGVPYRAESVMELVRTTEDGTASVHRTTGLVARDAAGRTLREDAMGPEQGRVVAIDDPVAGLHYVLFPERAKGRKFAEPLRERRLLRRSAGLHRPIDVGGAPPVKTESLGTQVIAGVEAEGTRDTITLPAGVHGNESPVEIVSERWYSPELKAVVRHLHRDARGERTWTLTAITRGEPEASLFEVPAGFEIEEGHR